MNKQNKNRVIPLEDLFIRIENIERNNRLIAEKEKVESRKSQMKLIKVNKKLVYEVDGKKYRFV